jgi:putative transposase
METVRSKGKTGILVNAECNGAANILTKVATQLGVNLAKLGRGALTLPRRVDLFKGLSKSYRKRCGAGLGPA